MNEKEFHEEAFLKSSQEEKEEEVAPGVIIERRRLLWLPAIVAAVLIGDDEKNSSAQDIKSNQNNSGKEKLLEPVSSGEIGWDDFLKQCLPMAAELHTDTSIRGQEAYLRWIGFMVSKLKLSDIPKAKLGQFGKLDPPVFFGVGYRGKPFFCVEWRMSAGAILPPHCHPNASVCTVGVEGEARIRNFEIIDKAPEFSSKQSFRVRETHNETIAPGRINTLSATRDNIHTFQAGKDGARGIDISTYHGPDVGFSFLEIQDKPKETETKIFDAVWKQPL